MLKGYNRRQKDERNKLLFLAWHTEVFARQKTLPALTSMMETDEPKEKHVQTDDEMLAMCRLLNAAFGGEVVEA